MYYVIVDGALVYDVTSDSSPVVSASISQQANAAAYLDMECLPGMAVEEGSSEVEVMWDGSVLFRGRVSDVSLGIDGLMTVSAVSEVDRLNDVLVRPHSTDGSVGERCPSDLAGYFEWLVSRYNERSVGGYRIDVGVNQADRLAPEGDALSLSVDSYQTVAAAIEGDVLSHGGWLEFRPYTGGGTVDLWADVHEAAGQMVDLGENVLSIDVTRDASEVHTAIVPYCGDVTLESATDDDVALARNAGLMVDGDAMYDPDAVARWGYREERVEVAGVSDVAGLVRAAVPVLRSGSSPSRSVTCRAVDMALYRDGYDHLRAGQAVRVRAALLDVDEYMVVQGMSLDLADPSQTSYELGVAYDTLTGQQGRYLGALNGSINEAIDRVSDAEDTIDRVVNDANTDYYLSDSPDEPIGGEWGVANVEQVDNKYLWARPHNTLVDGTEVFGDPTLVTPGIRRSLKLRRDVGDGPVWIAFVAANSDVTDPDAQGLCRISGQMGGWDAAEQGAVTVCFGFQDSAYAGGELAGVGIVTEKSSDIDLTKLDVQAYVDNGRVGVYVMLTGKVTVSLYAEGEGFSTPFVELRSEPSGERVFSLADAKTTYESAILQADNALRAYVEATYATKAGVGESIAQLDLRADQIQTSVEQKMDASVAETTFVNKSTFDQTVGSITTTVEQTQETAEGAASDASTALTKATTVEQTADGLQVTLTSTTKTANSALSAANAAQTAAANAAKTATNFLEFDSSGLCVGNLTSSTLGMNTLVAAARVSLRNGTTELATFSPTLVELGKNSTAAQIKMCGSMGTVAVSNGYVVNGTVQTMMFITSGSSYSLTTGVSESTDVASGMKTAFSSFDGPSQTAAIAGAGGTYIGTGKVNNAPVYVYSNSIRLGNSSTAIRCVSSGSKVVSVGGGNNSAVLFTASQIASLIGRKFNSSHGDAVFVMNGDGNACGLHPDSTTYLNGNIYVTTTAIASSTTSMRVNYLIVAKA